MIDQLGLKSLHFKVVHVPRERQWSLKLILISHIARLNSEGWYMYCFHSNALIRISTQQSGTCTTLESMKLKESYFGQMATTLHPND